MTRQLSIGKLTPRQPLWLPFDPFFRVFRLLTSVRFALVLIGVITIATLIGVVIPQVPELIRSQPQPRAEWLQEQHDRYGPLAVVLERLHMFEVFASAWFNALLALLVVSIAVCTCSRFPPIWRQITRTPRQVNDRYFETAHHRAAFAAPGEPERLERALKRRHYRVERVQSQPDVKLYADRYRWAQLGTFVSHLALVIFIAGGIVTWRLGDRIDLFIPEGASAPVFALGADDHMQVHLTDFVREQDELGRDIAMYSELSVYKGGEEVASGRSTINDPLEYDGLKFHQIAFAQDGAALEIRDGRGGRLLYAEVLQLPDVLPVPQVEVRDAAGNSVFSGLVPPTFFLTEGVSGAPLPVDDHVFTVALRAGPESSAEGPPWRLIVSGPAGDIQEILFGDSASIGDVQFDFAGLAPSNFAVIQDLPGFEGEETLVQMVRVDADESFLLLTDPAGRTTQLPVGEPAVSGDAEFTFLGPRNFSGITVRRDPGAGFIWVASALLMLGLLMTFYLPRRRLWVKIAGGQLLMAGIAERGVRFADDMAAIAREAGSPPAPANDERETAPLTPPRGTHE